MTTTLTAGGLLEIPEVFRQADCLQADLRGEIERFEPRAVFDVLSEPTKMVVSRGVAGWLHVNQNAALACLW